MGRNPFSPSFGSPPPLLVGRADLIDEFEDSLDQGPGSPGYITIYTGNRGSGKTVMLNQAEDVAQDSGFQVISETATTGFVDRLISAHLPALLPAKRRKVQGVQAAGVGITLERSVHREPILRQLLVEVTDRSPVLITVDELHAADIGELRTFATVLQHLVREQRPLAFAGAALPSALTDVLSDDVLTFLRRADRHTLGPIDEPLVADAFITVITDAGRTISPESARLAARATGGYGFMIQLVGFHAWKHSRDGTITDDDIIEGSIKAQRRIGRLVIEPAMKDLSPTDRTFLMAMAVDDDVTKMSDIVTRMDVTTNYASQYRLRLIASEMILPAGHGLVRFALPHLREWVREHEAFGAS